MDKRNSILLKYVFARSEEFKNELKKKKGKKRRTGGKILENIRKGKKR